MIWVELFFVAVVLGLAFQQLYSVNKARRERVERERAEAATAADDREGRSAD